MSKPRKKRRPPKRVLALPGLEQSKAAVLNTLTSTSGQRSYDRAITDFVDWYCSEPRLAFNRTVVLRYRIFLRAEAVQRQPSISAWPLSDVSRLKLPIPAFSARNSLPESDESRAYAGSEFALETGWQLNRRNGCSQSPIGVRCGARGITPGSRCWADADSAAASCLPFGLTPSSRARSIGSSPTSWAKLGTSVPSQSHRG